ncbi:MAG: 6-phosphogluconolactonase [Gammaproteobacteria bacterium]|nr:6-phosphogluconolactonase [Gammaproteobacteria bacterium]
MIPDQLHIANNLDDLNRVVINHLAGYFAEAMAAHGGFHLALSGGTTPQSLYQRLSQEPDIARLGWQHCHIYFGDERCVPPDHPDSNFRMADTALFSHISRYRPTIHRIAGELTDPALAARLYAETLQHSLPATEHGPCFDVVLLGLGPDGHVASLFPSSAILHENNKSVAACYVERLARWRISITFPVICHARHVMVLAAGDGKAEIIRQLFETDDIRHLPASRLLTQPNVSWHLDRAACRLLTSPMRPAR